MHLQKLAPTQWLTPTICSVSFGGSGDLIRVRQLLPSASSLRSTPEMEAGVGPCSRKIGAERLVRCGALTLDDAGNNRGKHTRPEISFPWR